MINLLRSNNYFFLLIIFCFNIRFAFILIDKYFLNHSFSQNDSIGFHLMSLEFFDVLKASIWAIDNNVHYFTNPDLIKWHITRSVYPYFLSSIYWLFGKEYIFGALISLIFFMLNIFLLKKILDYVCPNKIINNLLLTLFCFLPTSIIYGSLILRESLQALLMCVVIYSLLKIYFEKKIMFFFYAFIAFVILSFIHMTYFLGLIFFLGMITIIILSNFIFKLKYLFVFIIILSIPIFLYYNQIQIILINFLFNGVDLVLYRNASSLSEAQRTNFISKLDIHSINSLYDFVKYIFIGFMQYLFYPITYSKNFIYLDFLIILENFIRLLLILIIILNCIVARHINLFLILLFSLYLFIEFVWSLGTINYGTAIRHHYPLNTILIVLIAFSTSIVLKFNLKK